MTTIEVEKASADDEELLAVRQCINGKQWDQILNKCYPLCSDELCAIKKLILRRTRIVNAKKLRRIALSSAHDVSPGHLFNCVKTTQYSMVG